jgi:hypothetical protein
VLSELFHRPVGIVLDLLVGPVTEFTVLEVDTDVGNEGTGIVGLGVVGIEGESSITIVIISNKGVSRGDQQERSETEFTVLDQEEVVDVVLDEVVISDLTTSATVLVLVLDLDFFTIIDGEDTLSFMDISTDLTEINNVSFLLEFLVSGAQEFFKEVLTLFLISQNPGLGEVLIETEALRSVFISFSIGDQSITCSILSVQVIMTSNVVRGLGKARVLLSDLSAVEEKVENEVNISIQRHIVECVLLLLESWGNVLTNLGDDLVHKLVATSKVTDEVALFSKDKLRVFSKIGSVLITIVKIRLETHDLGIIVSTLDDTVFDDFKDIELGEEVVGSSGIIEIISAIHRLEIEHEHSLRGGISTTIVVESQESDSQNIQGKDAQCYIANRNHCRY